MGHDAIKPLRHYWHPEYIVHGIAAVLVVLAAIFFYIGMNATDTDKFSTTFAPNLATDCLGLAITVLVIDQLYRWRDDVYQQRIDESLAAQRKQSILLQMGSRSNEFALDASRIAKNEGWVNDGSLQGADLRFANLQGADLSGAKLQDANLIDAELQGAGLQMANLQDATLIEASLKGADLRLACLQGTMLMEANLEDAQLQGAFYDSKTRWPEGFDPVGAGAIIDNKRSFQA